MILKHIYSLIDINSKLGKNQIIIIMDFILKPHKYHK